MKLRGGKISGSHRRQDNLPPDSRFRYLADALGFLKMTLFEDDDARLKDDDARQPALVQVAALQTRPPRMQPSSLMVFASCKVRLPE